MNKTKQKKKKFMCRTMNKRVAKRKRAKFMCPDVESNRCRKPTEIQETSAQCPCSRHRVGHLSINERRAALVASRNAIGSRKQVLPIGAATKIHTVSQLCSLSSTSFCLIPFQLRSPRFSFFQTISALLNFCNSFQQLSKFLHLSPLTSTLFTSSLLFSTLPNDFRLHSSQLAPTLFASCHVFNSSHLF